MNEHEILKLRNREDKTIYVISKHITTFGYDESQGTTSIITVDSPKPLIIKGDVTRDIINALTYHEGR